MKSRQKISGVDIPSFAVALGACRRGAPVTAPRATGPACSVPVVFVFIIATMPASLGTAAAAGLVAAVGRVHRQGLATPAALTIATMPASITSSGTS